MELLKGLEKPYCFQSNLCRNKDTIKCDECASNETLQPRGKWDSFEEIWKEGTVPIKMQCSYCQKYNERSCGGRGSGKYIPGYNEPCYQFVHDPKGRVFPLTIWMAYSIGQHIPQNGEIENKYNYGGISAEITIKKILKVEWKTEKKIKINLLCKADIQVNDIERDLLLHRRKKEKPKLSIVGKED